MFLFYIPHRSSIIYKHKIASSDKIHNIGVLDYSFAKEPVNNEGKQKQNMLFTLLHF